MFKKIAPDKWKHFLVGIVMGAVLQIFFWWLLPGHPVLEIIVTVLMIIAICYGFELFSLITGHGHYELMDAVAGTIGGILGMGVVLVFGFY
jgi:hypothetical protein